jgi:ribosomal protein L37AE/L43A
MNRNANIPAASIDPVAVHYGYQCPECGAKGCEDNHHGEYRCVECDHRWGEEYGEPYGYEPLPQFRRPRYESIEDFRRSI